MCTCLPMRQILSATQQTTISRSSESWNKIFTYRNHSKSFSVSPTFQLPLFRMYTITIRAFHHRLQLYHLHKGIINVKEIAANNNNKNFKTDVYQNHGYSTNEMMPFFPTLHWYPLDLWELFPFNICPNLSANGF